MKKKDNEKITKVGPNVEGLCTDQGESYVHYAGKKEKVTVSENGKAERERKSKKGERREKENILSNKKQNTCKTSNKGMHHLSDTKI